MDPFVSERTPIRVTWNQAEDRSWLGKAASAHPAPPVPTGWTAYFKVDAVLQRIRVRAQRGAERGEEPPAPLPGR